MFGRRAKQLGVDGLPRSTPTPEAGASARGAAPASSYAGSVDGREDAYEDSPVRGVRAP
jgi:hypothetical protein